MAKVTALILQKGGTGKSTTAVNLGIGLAKHGKRVLLIDADSQANATQMLGWRQPDELNCTLATWMENYINELELPAKKGILHHEERIDLIPANIELSGMEVSLVNTMSREGILRGVIKDLRPHYDYIILDCGPSLGMMTINALAAADSIIIPVQAGYLPAKGLEQLLKTVGRVKKQLNPDLKIDGILLTMVGRNNMSKNIGELIRETYGSNLNVFNTWIPYSVRAAEASATGRSIYAFEPHGKVAAAYQNLIWEVLEIGRKKSLEKHQADISR